MSYASKNKTGAICLILLMVLAVVFVLMMLNGCTSGGGGFFPFGLGKPPKPPNGMESTSGAAVSWWTIKAMAVLAFVPGVGMLIASMFIPGIGIAQKGKLLIGIGIIIALVPWAAETLMNWLLGEVGPAVKWTIIALMICATLATITYACIFLWHEYKHRRGLCDSRLKGI